MNDCTADCPVQNLATVALYFIRTKVLPCVKRIRSSASMDSYCYLRRISRAQGLEKEEYEKAKDGRVLGRCPRVCVHRRLRPLRTQFSSSTAPARCAIKRGAICHSRAGIALFEVCFGRRSRDPLVHGTPQVSKSGTRSSIGLVQLCFSEPRRRSYDSKKVQRILQELCVFIFSAIAS